MQSQQVGFRYRNIHSYRMAYLDIWICAAPIAISITPHRHFTNIKDNLHLDLYVKKHTYIKSSCNAFPDYRFTVQRILTWKIASIYLIGQLQSNLHVLCHMYGNAPQCHEKIQKAILDSRHEQRVSERPF